MKINTIDASLCAKMFLAGAKNLESKKEWINELNVFPVPDGDTGTNMTLTIMSAAKEVAGMENITMETFAKAVSSGSLRGARGNSGVILSQLLRGFTKVIKTETEINAATLAAAFQKAVEGRSSAIMRIIVSIMTTQQKTSTDCWTRWLREPLVSSWKMSECGSLMMRRRISPMGISTPGLISA